MTKVSNADRVEAIEELRSLLNPGDTVYTVLKHVSRSGMMRIITPLILRADSTKVFNARGIRANADSPRYVTLDESMMGRYYLGYLAHKALGWSIDNDHGVKVDGCGMDMGFHLVYCLSSVIFRDGFDCGGERCTSCEHFNTRWYICATCGKGLEQKHFATIEEPTEANRFRMGVTEGREWYGTEPKFTRLSRSHNVAVCSQECADAPWHHRDGGYALTQKWL